MEIEKIISNRFLKDLHQQMTSAFAQTHYITFTDDI